MADEAVIEGQIGQWILIFELLCDQLMSLALPNMASVIPIR